MGYIYDTYKNKFRVKAGFQSIGTKEELLYGESEGEIGDDLLYIGNLDEGCQFDITMSLLNEAAKMEYDNVMQQAYKEENGEFPNAEQFACAVGKVSIVIE